MLSAKQLKRQIFDTVRATEPIEPRCQHAHECGGCAFQDRAYPAQLATKRAALHTIWQNDLPTDLLAALDIVASPEPFAYRTRMDYVAAKGRFGLRRGGKFNYIIDLQECHLIPPAAFRIVRGVYQHMITLGLPDYNLRTHEGFLRYLVVRRSPDDQVLLAAVTNTSDNQAAMNEVATAALGQPGVVSFHWLLNDSLTDISFGTSIQHWGAATLPMRVGSHTLQIGPNTFFQNNVHLLEPLLDAIAAALGTPERVADLYGGVGTIALHLAAHVPSLVTVESVAESAALAQHNIAANGCTNVQAYEADVLPFLRDQRAGAFDTLVADPPRIGMGPDVCNEILRLGPQRIVYVSCNPLTLFDDVRALSGRYQIRSLQGYDMFPHTPHMEALAILDRIS